MATGGRGGRGGIGWVILVAALAVPGFLFYNWWSHLKAEHDHAISAKASKRADGGVFQTPLPPAGRLINPMAPSTGAPAGFPPAAAAARIPLTTAGTTPPGAMSAGTVPAGTVPAGTVPAGTVPAGTVPAGIKFSSTTTPGAAATATASLVSLSTAATIVLSRDPMMSPLDAVRLQEAAMAEGERLRALAEANRRHTARRVKPVRPAIESKIELQGIVAKSDGVNLAIINGSTVNPGESFAIENYPGRVRVLKITPSEVTLGYNGRKIKLSVNAE